MSSLLRTWPWRTDDFVLDHNHARQPTLCLDPDGAAHAVWLLDTDTIRNNWRVTEIRHAEADGTQATLSTMTNYRQPVMTPRAVWGRRGLELFVLARFRNQWLVCRPRSSDRWSPVFRSDQHVLSFDATVGDDGLVAFAYQTRLASGCQIYLRLGADSAPIEVGRADIPKWRPIVTPGRGGRFWVVWEAFHAGQFRVFARQVFPDGGLGPVLVTPSDDRFCLDASADVDREGRLWLACRCVEAWGERDHFLNADAKIALSCIGTDRVLATYEVPIPDDPERVKLPATPTVLCHAEGGVSVFFRWFRNAMPNDWGWDVNQITLRDNEWSEVRKLATAVGRSDERIEAAENGDHLWLCCQTCAYDGHRDPTHDSSVRLKRINQREFANQFRGRIEASSTRLPAVTSTIRHGGPTGEPRADTVALGPTELSVLWGDLHRHTHASKCISENDGTLLDHYRWAMETARLDFYAVTDHYSYINADDWAECLRLADVFHAPGHFVPLIGYEWHHEGHANFYFLDEDAAAAVWREHAGLRSLAELYDAFDAARLRRRVAVIRHYHADGLVNSAQQFWGSVNRDFESVAEVIQTRGCSPRSYECLLSHGRRLGCVGGSDHSRRPDSGMPGVYVYAASLTGLYAEAVSREAIFDALRRRRAFATNGKRMAVWLSVDDVFMGGEGLVSSEPAIVVHADATTEIERVQVLRDGKIIADRAASEESIEFVITDEDITPGDHYYTVRVQQKPDSVHDYCGLAWSSPVWVTIEGRAGAAPG